MVCLTEPGSLQESFVSDGVKALEKTIFNPGTLARTWGTRPVGLACVRGTDRSFQCVPLLKPLSKPEGFARGRDYISHISQKTRDMGHPDLWSGLGFENKNVRRRSQ
jgi:hypothetical protein